MADLIDNERLERIFFANRKCIVNADLDGILSGMLLQHYLDWKVVGYSSCCGKLDDELWLQDGNENLEDCVFVDLPVCVDGYSVIDQHFVAFNDKAVAQYINQTDKINPNILRGKAFAKNQYTQKYPFGTAHFVIAVLEKLGVIEDNDVIDFTKKIEKFDLADLVLRADRVIGNTCQYTPNCLDWCDWLMNLGGRNTKALFTLVKNEYGARLSTEKSVEQKLKSFGCAGSDGDCSNLFRAKNYTALGKYFAFLSECLEIEALPVFAVVDYGKLAGKRYEITNLNIVALENKVKKDNVFSYAFVTMRALSVTYIEE